MGVCKKFLNFCITIAFAYTLQIPGKFNYYTNEILHEEEQSERFYEIELTYGDVLCLDFSDEKKRYRKVITTFFDNYSEPRLRNGDS